MNDAIKEMSERFEALELRERWLVFLASLVIVWLLIDTLAIAPLGAAINKEQSNQAAAQSQLEAARNQLVTLQRVLENDPLAVKIRERRALEQQLVDLDNELTELSVGLVKAEALPKILEELLAQAGDLQLQSMVTEPPELQLSDVYKHQVTVTLSGGFVDVFNYLKLLEGLPWKFYWEELEYTVTDYPRADVTIRVYTLSTAEGSLNA